MAVHSDAPFDIAVIGGGAAGVLVAIHALRLATAPRRIVLVEPSADLAQGAAYATPCPEHVLNVPARGMSAFADAPADFLDYVAAGGGDRDALAWRFVERRRYADYLLQRLEEARTASPATLQIHRDRATGLDFANGRARLALAGGTRLHAQGVVLAPGNSARPLPASDAEMLPAAQSLAAWDYAAVKGIDRDADVGIVGSGLSMADALLSLAANGHRGRLHVLSRHAILPLPHAQSHQVADFDVEALLALDLRQRVRALRRHARDAAGSGLPWQSVFERLRPHGQALWQSLPERDRRRFLRHVVRHWDVHRHRVAPEVHRCVESFRASGQLQLHRGHLSRVAPHDDRVLVDFRDRDGHPQRLVVDVVVNATGVQTRAAAMRNPLLDALLASGLARPGPHGIGLDTAPDGRLIDAEGDAAPRLFVLGSLRIGNLWESLAVPELRVQAESIAQALLS